MTFTYDFAEIDGKVPMVEFLESLNIRERAKIFAYIDKLVALKTNGIQPKENLSKHLEDGIFELRVSHDNRISRCLYFFEAQRQIMFTHGYVKKEQKTPKSVIEKAKSIRKALGGRE
jgi:phage-related protein